MKNGQFLWLLYFKQNVLNRCFQNIEKTKLEFLKTSKLLLHFSSCSSSSSSSTHLDLNLCALELEDNLQDETARSVKCRVSEPQMSASNVSAGLIVVYSVCCCWCWEDNLSSYMLCNATCPNLQFVCLHFKVCFFFCCCFCCCCCCCIFISTTAAAALQTTPSS